MGGSAFRHVEVRFDSHVFLNPDAPPGEIGIGETSDTRHVLPEKENTALRLNGCGAGASLRRESKARVRGADRAEGIPPSRMRLFRESQRHRTPPKVDDWRRWRVTKTLDLPDTPKDRGRKRLVTDPHSLIGNTICLPDPHSREN